MIEGARAGSGYVPLTFGSGSGSRRPKNIRIRRIRIRILIHNLNGSRADLNYSASLEPVAAGSGIPQVKCYLNGVKVLFPSC
jgi:hypothetical protein